jgi:hypothetical protein
MSYIWGKEELDGRAGLRTYCVNLSSPDIDSSRAREVSILSPNGVRWKVEGCFLQKSVEVAGCWSFLVLFGRAVGFV